MNNHQKTKKQLKVIGIILVSIGGVCAIIGFVDFFIAMANMSQPTMFFLLFIGIPLLGIGGSILGFAFRSEIMRYNKNESVPIINEASDEMKPTFRNVASAVKESMNESIVCSCGTTNDKDSRFCKKCGKELYKVCPNCNAKVENDSEFCTKCGTKL